MSFSIDETYNVNGTGGSFEVKCIFICKKYNFVVLSLENLSDVCNVPWKMISGDKYFLMVYIFKFV